jgi:hypothetical protein
MNEKEKKILFENAKKELIMNIENLENDGDSLRLIQVMRDEFRERGFDFIFYSPYIRREKD